jgi:hypothetical protein
MPAVIRVWIVCIGVAYAGLALAAPRVDPRVQYKKAAELDEQGDYQAALGVIEKGLAVAPKDLRLLGLKGALLLKLRDYPEALVAYQAYLDAGATGANRREAQKIVDILRTVKSTSLEVAVANGPAEIYLDSKTQGLFCSAAPACSKPVLPGEYKVIAERPGFQRWTGNVSVANGQSQKVSVTLVEKPSLLTVRAEPAGARITVDDAAHEAPAQVAAGKHRVEVSLAGHRKERREVEAREGKPVELVVALTPVVPVRIQPPGAQVLLDGQPAAIEQGELAMSPGEHAIVVRAQGFQERELKVPAERPEGYEVVVELARVVPPPPPPPPPPLFTGRRKLAVASAGVGVVALGAGVMLGLQAKGLDDDAYKLCPSPTVACPDAVEANDLNSRSRSRALTANIAFGVAGGAAIAAAVLWLTGAPESRTAERRVSVTPRLGGSAGLDLAVRF